MTSRSSLCSSWIRSINPTLWFRVKFADWYQNLDEPARARMQERIQGFVDTIPSENRDQLIQLEQCCRDLPEVTLLQARLVELENAEIAELSKADNPSTNERELTRLKTRRNLYLQQLARHDVKSGGLWAVAYLEELQQEHEQTLALQWLDDISARWKESPLIDNLTGAQFAEVKREEIISARTSTATYLDIDEYEVQKYDNLRSGPTTFRRELEHMIDRPGPFAKLHYFWNPRSQELTAETDYQEQKWVFPIPGKTLATVDVDRTSIFSSGPYMLLKFDNSLSLWVSRGPEVVPLMLWTKSIQESSAQTTSGGINSRLPWYEVSEPYAGPVIEDRVYYRVGGNLHAVDLLTGRALWELKNISDSAALFGAGAALGLISRDRQLPRELTAVNS
ncbi:MAG: hypothetical protein R3C11_12230 [Planctomycetaceae bacterium]